MYGVIIVYWTGEAIFILRKVSIDAAFLYCIISILHYMYDRYSTCSG